MYFLKPCGSKTIDLPPPSTSGNCILISEERAGRGHILIVRGVERGLGEGRETEREANHRVCFTSSSPSSLCISGHCG